MDQPDDVAMPFLLMRAFRELVDAVHDQLAEQGFPGVKAHHGFALQAIGQGCTSVGLGARLGVSKQAAAKSARTLEDWGLVARELNEQDRRERRLVLTARGRRLLRLSADAFRREVAAWRDRIGDDAVSTTLRTLGEVGGTRSDTDLSDWQ